MMRVLLQTENAAFEDELAGPECARILRLIADRVEGGDVPPLFQTILDADGNDVGRYKFDPRNERPD